MQTVSLIAALGRNRVIGRGRDVPWRLPADLKRFKQITMGHSVIMGRKTHASIGRPLSGRRNIVLTRDDDHSTPGCERARSLDEALALAGDGEVFVIGGGDVYEQALPKADRLYLTMIDLAPEGDVRFPEIDAADWREVERVEGVVDAVNPHPHAFVVLERRRGR